MFSLPKVFTLGVYEKLSRDFVPFIFILGFPKLMQRFYFTISWRNFSYFYDQRLLFCLLLVESFLISYSIEYLSLYEKTRWILKISGFF